MSPRASARGTRSASTGAVPARVVPGVVNDSVRRALDGEPFVAELVGERARVGGQVGGSLVMAGPVGEQRRGEEQLGEPPPVPEPGTGSDAFVDQRQRPLEVVVGLRMDVRKSSASSSSCSSWIERARASACVELREDRRPAASPETESSIASRAVHMSAPARSRAGNQLEGALGRGTRRATDGPRRCAHGSARTALRR